MNLLLKRLNKGKKMEAKQEELNDKEIMQQIIMLESLAKKNMTKEAIARYGNLKMAHPETAVKAIAVVAQASELGHIARPLTDDDFRALLIEIQRGKTTYNFKK